MHVLHCFWTPGDRLSVWAEDSGLADSAFAGRVGKRGRKAVPHPFAAAPDEIRAGLGLETAGSAETVEHELWLPVTKGRPQPSPKLPLGDNVRTGRADRLLPWAVPTLDLPIEHALPLLVSPPQAAPHTAVGTGWHELGQVALLALALVTTGRFLPGLTARGDCYEAVWFAVPTAAQRAHLRRLGRELPGSVRAADPTGRVALDIVQGLLSAATDHVVRSSARPAARRTTTPVDLWLDALAGEAQVAGGAPDLAPLAAAAQGWIRDAAPAEGSMRTCFRLIEPAGTDEPDEDEWTIEFHLQSTEDPSLLVPADQVWSVRDAAELSGFGVDHPQDVLLRDLGTASRVYPPLGASLDIAEPSAWRTDAGGAAEFLGVGAADLERNGFGVLLPDWSKRPPRLGVRLEARQRPMEAGGEESADSGAGTGRLGADALVDFDWRLSVGDDPITEEELERLAALKAPLVRVRGKWAWLSPEAVDAALEFVARRSAAGGPRPEDAPGLLDALRLASTAIDVVPPEAALPEGLPVLGIDADGALGNLLSGDVDALRPTVIPESFHGVLRPYQERGVAWLAWLGRLGLGACLADDMGLGKTIQLLALLASEGDPGNGAGPTEPTLLVCPTTVLGNWVREVQRFVPTLRIEVNHGPGRSRGDDLVEGALDSDLFLTTYALVVRDRDALASVPWRRVVLDEAQHVKNPRARQTRAIRHVADASGAHRVALTGTPVENRLGDLWSLMAFLNPGLLGSARSFRESFAVPIERYGDAEVLDRLTTLVRPFLLRRVKADPDIAPELPPKIERDETCVLTREQASLYRSVTDEMLGRIDEMKGDDPDTRRDRRGIVLAAILRLKQICNHPALYLDDGSELAGRSGKLERLEELVDVILSEGDRVLVFSQFAGWGGLLRRRLQEVTGREALFLHGGTPRRKRDELVDRFQHEEGPQIFVMSLKAGGVGLNLTAATHVIHYDRWWNPAVENQATDRAYRIGQTRGVDVHRFVCAGTIEERIGALMSDKQKLADTVVGSGEGWLARLDVDELRRIVTFSGEV